MTRFFSLLVVALIAARSLSAPPEALAIAVKHARTLPPDPQRNQRYLDLTHLDLNERVAAGKVLSFHLNCLSREPDIVPPQSLAGGAVLTFDLRDYGIDQFVYGRLGSVEAAEPYFHVVLETSQAGKAKEKTSAAAPWLPFAEIAELIQLTGSKVPIVRGDWFFSQTAIQADRQAGYYDMLGLGKKEADFQKLIGANAAEAKRLKLEMAASITQSGVALHNRGISRMQSLTGGYWFTQDFKQSTNKKNTARLLQGDTEPPAGDASEQFGVLPNRLFAFWLQNDKQERQDSAPDFIASDGRSTSPDRRVHAGMSCIRCHVEGLRPLDDYARKLYRGQIQLRSPDYEKFKRLRQLYLSNLDGQREADNSQFAAAVKACNGLPIADNAKFYGEFWERYNDVPMTAAAIARELGCDEKSLLDRVLAYAQREPVIDPVAAALAQIPPLPVRREHFEETYSVFQKIVGNVP